MNPSPDLLSSADAAARFGFSEPRLRQWRWQKRGPRYLKISTRCYYRVEDFESWLARHAIEPEGDAGRSQ
jgi:hypothetical protein